MLVQTHTHTEHTLSDTHTSFPETYLLSHTPRSLSNPPWWRLIAAFRACWAPPVKVRGLQGNYGLCLGMRDCPEARSIMEDHDRLDLWSQTPQLDHRHGAIRPGWQAHRVNPTGADSIAAGWRSAGAEGTCDGCMDIGKLRRVCVCSFIQGHAIISTNIHIHTV